MHDARDADGTKMSGKRNNAGEELISDDQEGQRFWKNQAMALKFTALSWRKMLERKKAPLGFKSRKEELA